LPENIASLTVYDPAFVSISPLTPLIDTLTISGISGIGLITGININSGAGFTNMAANVILAGASQTITVDNAAGLLMSGVVDGTIGLTKAGIGQLTLTGANIYTNGTLINAGILAVGSASALGNGFVTNKALLDTTASNNLATAPLTINVKGAYTQTAAG